MPESRQTGRKDAPHLLRSSCRRPSAAVAGSAPTSAESRGRGHRPDRPPGPFPLPRPRPRLLRRPGQDPDPRPVADAITATLTGPLSNRGVVSPSELNAERAVTEFRAAYADLLNVPADGIVHGRSATQLTYDFSRHLAKGWKAGDEIVLSRLDHDCNVRPWVQAAERAGVTVRWIEIDAGTTELDLDSFERALSPRTRLVAVTAASNVLGTKPPVRRIADRAHEVGALVTWTGCTTPPITWWTCPGWVRTCSSARRTSSSDRTAPCSRERRTPRNPPAGQLPAVPRHRAGALRVRHAPYEILAGATAAVEFLAVDRPGRGRHAPGAARHVRWALLHEHEWALRTRLEDGLRALGDLVTVHSKAADRTPTLLMTLEGRDAREAQVHLAARDVLAPAGRSTRTSPSPP